MLRGMALSLVPFVARAHCGHCESFPKLCGDLKHCVEHCGTLRSYEAYCQQLRCLSDHKKAPRTCIDSLFNTYNTSYTSFNPLYMHYTTSEKKMKEGKNHIVDPKKGARWVL